ncbi:prostate-associated microseminoprotein-like [Crassostrea virginica]
MERIIFISGIISILLVYAEAACWLERGNGSSCHHEGVTLHMGQTYVNTTGPTCYKCECMAFGELGCCNTGISIRDYPADICKVLRRGCNDVAVSKTNEDEPCDGTVAAVIG